MVAGSNPVAPTKHFSRRRSRPLLTWILYLSAGWLSGRLPRWLGLKITFWVAVIFRWTHPQTVRIVEHNLEGIERAMGRPYDPLMVPEVFDAFARSVYEFVSLPHRSTTEILQRYRVVRGEEFLHRRLGEGLLILSAHLAGWEMGGAWLAENLGPFHTVALEHPSKKVTEYFTQRRAQRGIIVHPLGRSYRPLLEALQRGETVVLLCDRNFASGGTSVEFFGREAKFPDGYLRLARESGARILPIFARRVGSSTELRIEEPLRVEEGGEGECLRKIVGLLEKHVGRNPEQWARFTPIWEEESDE